MNNSKFKIEEIEIREVREEDYEDMAKIFYESSLLHNKNDKTFKKPGNFKSYKEDVIASIQGYQVYTALYEKNVVGVVQFLERKIAESSEMTTRNPLTVKDIAIKKDFHKKGIGALLMNKVFEIAKEDKIDEVILNVWGFNEKALNFYKKLGFDIEYYALRREIK
ncbi:MAG: GNAT family N-acetyltransferase [Patescibacteria group bacterium]